MLLLTGVPEPAMLGGVQSDAISPPRIPFYPDGTYFVRIPPREPAHARKARTSAFAMSYSLFLMICSLLPIVSPSRRIHDHHHPDLRARSIGRFYQYESIAHEQSFKLLDSCAADCLFKPCYGNSTCEATKHSVDFELGCIASTCICEATRFRADAEEYIQTCALKYCDGDQAQASAAHEVLQVFCESSPPDPGPTSSMYVLTLKQVH